MPDEWRWMVTYFGINFFILKIYFVMIGEVGLAICKLGCGH
jgi:hypothetical protein